jgi:putative Mn2+ efflux pump MntP
MILVLIGAHLSIFVPGYIDELDFWAGNFILLFFGIVEIIFFIWLFGPDNFIRELNEGSVLRIPKWVAYLTGTVSLAFLVIILLVWIFQNLPSLISQTGLRVWLVRDTIIIVIVISQKDLGVWLGRATIFLFLLMLGYLTILSSRKEG